MFQQHRYSILLRVFVKRVTNQIDTPELSTTYLEFHVTYRHL